jgi:hypothetical protein
MHKIRMHIYIWFNKYQKQLKQVTLEIDSPLQAI